MMKKYLFLITIFIIILLSPLSQSNQVSYFVDFNKENSLEPFSKTLDMWIINSMRKTTLKNSMKTQSIIDNLTWAVMRYDFNQNSENHGNILVPTPSAGSILIPANMMSTDICHAAVAVHRDSKIETLRTFDEYVSSRMLHTSNAFTNGEDEWNTESCYNFRKESAVEMNALGSVCLRADLVGECYAQASYNTALLRLAGFSAEEVFTVGIQSFQGGHAVNIINVDGGWYVLDSTFSHYVRMGIRDSIIFEKYFRPPITDYLIFLENDKYMINFGTLYPQYIPTMEAPYSNMDSEMLEDIVEEVLPLFNNSFLGKQQWSFDSFIENATAHPLMKSAAIPYNVEDAIGATIEEKALDLSNLCRDFIFNQDDENGQDQYDKSCYALGLLSVEYPQVYANAAKLAAWTSWYGIERDMSRPFLDVFTTLLFTRLTLRTKQVLPGGCVAYSDLLYLCHAGSSIDKVVLAYGTLRNMEKNDDFWQPEDIFVLITEDYQGYLAINLDSNWRYLSFGKERLIQDSAPEDITMVFNENDYFNSWEN